jgi:hypothetical protein
MSKLKEKRSESRWNTDESYDRYKRPRWRPVLLLAAGLVLVLAFRLDMYRPHILLLSILPSSILSLDQRVERIMSLTPLMGMTMLGP